MNSAQPTIIGARNSSGEILNSLGLIGSDHTSAPITIWKSPHPVNAPLRRAAAARVSCRIMTRRRKPSSARPEAARNEHGLPAFKPFPDVRNFLAA
jgi:hypothetical protein